MPQVQRITNKHSDKVESKYKGIVKWGITVREDEPIFKRKYKRQFLITLTFLCRLEVSHFHVTEEWLELSESFFARHLLKLLLTEKFSKECKWHKNIPLNNYVDDRQLTIDKFLRVDKTREKLHVISDLVRRSNLSSQYYMKKGMLRPHLKWRNKIHYAG